MGSEPESLSPPARGAGGAEEGDDGEAACCSCDCRRRRGGPAWRRAVKRKLEEVEGGSGGGGGDVAARVEAGDEAVALREALAGHQQTVAELWAELEEERSASASAASEAMSMILRLQREKAEAQMEARQFRRFAEEKMAHDQQELVALDDLLYKREQSLQALSCEVQSYRHRLLSYGLPPDPLHPASPEQPPALDDAGETEPPLFDYAPTYEYPPLRCHDHHHGLDPSLAEEEYPDDLDKDPPGATPRSLDHLQNLEHRIHRLERSQSRTSLVQEMEKGVVMAQSPRPVRARHAAGNVMGSPLAKEQMCNGRRHEEFPAAVSSYGADDDDGTGDRVYTVDAVHKGAASHAPTARPCEEYLGTPREETDVKKLYMRLEALEADRESMRQAIISMRTDKAQLVLLKEIAQHLYRDASSPPAAALYRDASASPSPWSGKKLVKNPSLLGCSSFMSSIKWILSFIFWKRKAQRSKQIFGPSSNSEGLLLLLEKAPRMRQWRGLSRIQG